MRKRPMLRYHGGKWMLAPWVISHFPDHRIYVESFGGGGSVLLRKERCYSEVYNELDPEIVNVVQVVRDPELNPKLRQALEHTLYARAELLLAYQPSEDPLERARRTIVRSFQGFGGPAVGFFGSGFRSNSNRSGTTPAHDWVNYPRHLDTFLDRFRGVIVEQTDAVQCMKQHDTLHTLHYVDPPYLHSTRRTTRRAYRFEMTDEQHVLLLDALKKLHGAVVLSGYSNELYEETLKGWRRVERKAHSNRNGQAIEVLWMNYRCEYLKGAR